MMDGIKFNLIYLILHDVLMVLIILKHFEFKYVDISFKELIFKKKKFFFLNRFMQIAVFDVFTSRIDSIRKMNCRRNLNYIYRYVSNLKIFFNLKLSLFVLFRFRRNNRFYEIHFSFLFFFSKTKIKILYEQNIMIIH